MQRQLKSTTAVFNLTRQASQTEKVNFKHLAIHSSNIISSNSHSSAEKADHMTVKYIYVFMTFEDLFD